MSKTKFLVHFGLLIFLFLQFVSPVVCGPSIEPELKHFLDKDETCLVDIIISMVEDNSKPLQEINRRDFHSREDRLNTAVRILQQFSSHSTQNVLQFLNRMKLENRMEIHPLWISNEIIVRYATLEVVRELKNFEEIRSINMDKIIHISPPVHNNSTRQHLEASRQFPWGIQAIDAPSVWKQGHRGAGIVVATIDTGVRITHEALQDNYIGKYGWYDPRGRTPEAGDKSGHGTHVTGTIVGTTRNIGVAPESKWMACKGCQDNKECFDSDLRLCGQWIMCPTNWDGSSPNCRKAPHLVCNSWSGGQGRGFFDAIIRAWQSASIIPIFAIGNSGPNCGTANSPGDRPFVIGVGATTNYNTVASFSSRGPAVDDRRIKPDISAPGDNILSASAFSDSEYVVNSGTSMAAPHVAGLVALLLSKNEDLRYNDVVEALVAGSLPTKTQPRIQVCDKIPEYQYPNNQVGYGGIHALRSINQIQSTKK